MNCNKKIIALALSAVLTVGAVTPAVIYAEDAPVIAEEQSANVADSSERVWKTDIRMSIAAEDQLMEQKGMTLGEWDAEVSEMKQAGLSAPLTEEGIKAADADADIRKENDAIYYIGENSALPEVKDEMDAYKAVYSLSGMLGGDNNTDLRLWSKLQHGNITVYSFQQISESQEVLGSVIKIAVDENGKISAVFSGLTQDSSKEEKLITQEEASGIVEARMKEEGKDVSVLPEKTERIIYLPWDMGTALNLDEMQNEIIPQQILWVVYTENDDNSEGYGYLAHYMLLDGTYLYSLPVKEPGDEESKSGFRKQDVFADMEADTFTGEVTTAKGGTREVTVPVMHSRTDGKWYLGDVNRRIAVADFKEAAYSDDHKLVLLSSSDNKDWEDGDILMFLNYIHAYDFYKDMGWDGSDGKGNDEIILKNMCTSDGTLFENACSLGKIENYSMFGYTPTSIDGTENGIAEALDVMAHEFTHTFTSTVMNDNLYENDLGAINEAMSDIMGNLCEYICKDTTDTQWLLGENTMSPIRSMSDPNAFNQPSFVWDVFYGPHTDKPSETNDRGGVHSNSSLLNRVAALLCLDYGMSYEEAVSLWTMTAMGMTPRTDYVQIPTLLHWAADVRGLEKYDDAIEALAEEEQMDRTTLPETLPEDAELVRLRLPDTEVFDDPDWVLFGFSLNEKQLSLLAQTGMDLISAALEDPEDMNKLSDIIRDLAGNLKMDTSGLKLDLSNMEQSEEEIKEILMAAGNGLLKQYFSWEEGETGEIPMLKEKGFTIYILMNMKQAGTKLNGAAVLIGNKWLDFSDMVKQAETMKDDSDAADVFANLNEEQIEMQLSMLSSIGESLLDSILGEDESEKAAEGTIGTYLPANGLEDVKLIEAE